MGYVIAFILGCWFGIFTMALMFVAKRSDENE